MKTNANAIPQQIAQTEWIPFAGGELEGRRPRALCAACRERLRRAVNTRSSLRGIVSASPDAASGATARRPTSQPPLCFGCYRAELARERALKAAGELDTATEARFQSVLPLEPVDQARLGRLRAERTSARATARSGAGRFVDRRRQAQIAARHALQQIGAGLRMRSAAHAAGSHASPGHADSLSAAKRGAFTNPAPRARQANAEWSAIHAAELQLPEAWLPFVVSR
jgi:hypothetical protein